MMWVALALNHDHREQPATVDEVGHPTRYKDQGQPSATGIRRKQILDKTQFQRWKVWPGDEIRGGNAFLNWKKKKKASPGKTEHECLQSLTLQFCTLNTEDVGAGCPDKGDQRPFQGFAESNHR